MSLLRALRRRSALAFFVALLAAGIAGPAAFYLVPSAKYKAQACLQVTAQPPKVLFQTMETEADDYRRYQSTQQTLVTSRLVLNSALKENEVRNYRLIRSQVDPVAWLQTQLKAEFLAGSEVMAISLSGDEPEELAGLVNAVKRAYMDEVVNVNIKQRIARHAKLKQIKERYNVMLKERRDTLRKLAETAGSDDRDTLALRQQYELEYQAFLRKELLDVKSQKRKVEARIRNRAQSEETAGGNALPQFTQATVDALVDQDPSVAEVLRKLNIQEERLNAQRLHLQRVARNAAADPSDRAMRELVAATRKLLAQRRSAVRPAVIRRLQEQGTEEQVAQADELDQDLAVLNDLERQLNGELEATSKGSQSMTKNTLDLRDKQDEVAQMHAAATKVGDAVEAMSVELDAPPRIRDIEDAVVPRTRDQKQRYAMIALAILGSFFGGLFGVAFLEVLSHKVDSTDQVAHDLGLHVVGTLPIVRSSASRSEGIARPRGEKDRYWQNLMLESIDATRTMLVHAARSGSHRVVMIASAVASEGKTSLASHLATSLARSGLRTLLMDADLRCPSIHRLFDVPLAAGLAELLRGEVGLAAAISDTGVPELKVLTAGNCDRQTVRVLAQGSLGDLFVQLKEQFDFVIVDSSPILPVADALLVAQQTDAVLFSIFREVSRTSKVSAASQRLQSLGVRILGAVVTGDHGGLYGGDYNPSSPYHSLPESAAKGSSARKPASE
jgi:capsular exopolysaccharide synthesis family protein